MRIWILFIILFLYIGMYLLVKTFPIMYYDVVINHTKNIDPLLIQSVMHVESNFRQEAISPLGAVGIMQIMPSTAKWINDFFGTDFDYLDTEGNIALGILYLEYLLEKYENLDKALISYNTGPYAREDIKKSAGMRYLHKIKRAYTIYKILYRR
ncbi:lytic transglycosylase domain-containing protein [Thermosipho ferrireducens]|uniref:Lytic transglycosylase domain-containing protein n=1 Tax=Thermosipho ferrireducens TaxID=2571116 RepID=A0ABX7S5A7_9BACT|nr:lytic transglycosylase domain-containing protein [Thermosipho ferrireducens]QTA37706.1 lytic transglycosylase domain-containing protein [Thermosipho ferrireducens]